MNHDYLKYKDHTHRAEIACLDQLTTMAHPQLDRWPAVFPATVDELFACGSYPRYQPKVVKH